MSANLSFKINEAYKKITKRTAIKIIKIIQGPLKTHQNIPQNPGSIVILGQERFGDIIVMTPLLKKLRSVYPEIEITVLGVTDMIEILKPDTNLNTVCNIKHADEGTRTIILSKTYDLLYNTKDHPSFTFMKLTAKIKAKHKVGIKHGHHKGFFHHMIDLEDVLPTVKKNLAIIDYLRIPLSDNDLKPYLPDGPVSSEIEEFVSSLSGKNIVGINLSASNRSKEWGLEQWIKFLKNVKEKIIVLAAPGHAEEKERLEKLYSNIIPSPLTPTMFDVGYIVRHLSLLVTPDTSLVHVASCYNTPIVAMYRIERDLKKFLPLSDIQRIHLSSTGVLDDIPPKDVLKSYRSILEEITKSM